MNKYVNVDELKKIVTAEAEKDGNPVAVAMVKWFCAVVDEMPAADVVEKEVGKE